MTSIGYTNLYGSVARPINYGFIFPNNKLSLGGGIPGFIPQVLVTTNNSSRNTDPIQTRFI